LSGQTAVKYGAGGLMMSMDKRNMLGVKIVLTILKIEVIMETRKIL
jgi:hypothetical protein